MSKAQAMAAARIIHFQPERADRARTATVFISTPQERFAEHYCKGCGVVK